MDNKCIDICNAMNSLNGIETTESCCGHGNTEYVIFFKVTDAKGLFFLTRCVDRRYWKYGGNWRIELSIGDSFENNYLPIVYLLTSVGVKGEQAYDQIKDLIENMNIHLNHKAFLNGYNLSYEKLVKS